MSGEVFLGSVGSVIKVTYLDHTSADELHDAVPAVNSIIGYFVNNDTDPHGRQYMVLSMDMTLSDQTPLHPYSAILYAEVLSIVRLEVVVEK